MTTSTQLPEESTKDPIEVEENTEPDPWMDPNLPAGLAPPGLPTWPFYLAALGWLTVIGFLIAMAVSSSS